MARVHVVGLGLIGASVALAARERLDAEVTGEDPDPAAIATALERGAIDRTGTPVDAGVVVVAAPVAQLPAAVRAALTDAPADAVVCDVGSTKAALVKAVTDERFVGSHPLAGSEQRGGGAARADLLAGAPWYLVPGERSSGVAFERLHRFVTALGSRPVTIDADEHDRTMAAVSHLPHVLANVLVAQAAEALSGDGLPAVGPGFRDAARTAGANPSLWAQIYAANADALDEQLEQAIARLQRVRATLRDPQALEAWQAAAAGQRAALLEAPEAGGPLRELAVRVPNAPGVVARIALALGRAQIDIADMSLRPSPDRRDGEVRLWVAAADAERARRTIDAEGHTVT